MDSPLLASTCIHKCSEFNNRDIQIKVFHKKYACRPFHQLDNVIKNPNLMKAAKAIARHQKARISVLERRAIRNSGESLGDS